MNNTTEEKNFEELVAEAPHRYPLTDMEIALITKLFTLSDVIHSGLVCDEKGHYHKVTDEGLDFFTDLHNFLVDIVKEDEDAIRKMDNVADLIKTVQQNNKATRTVGKGGAVDIFRNVN